MRSERYVWMGVGVLRLKRMHIMEIPLPPPPALPPTKRFHQAMQILMKTLYKDASGSIYTNDLKLTALGRWPSFNIMRMSKLLMKPTFKCLYLNCWLSWIVISRHFWTHSSVKQKEGMKEKLRKRQMASEEKMEFIKAVWRKPSSTPMKSFS